MTGEERRLFSLRDKGRIHVAGVAGVGMSALAELLLALGYRVSGSDREIDRGELPEAVSVLRRSGLQIFPQDGSALTKEVSALAVSTAIENDNAELHAAKKQGIPVVHRAEMIARLAEGKRVVAIAGTAGKTTVTAMVGWLLEQAGFDPTVVNGGVVLNWRSPSRLGNVRVGRSAWWVVEVDESDRSLLGFHPEHALITNVSKDHFSLEEARALFRGFAGQVNGKVLVGPGISGWLSRDVVEPVFEVERVHDWWRVRVDSLDVETNLPGRHNAENAALAVALCRALGADPGDLRAAMPRFLGVHRRLELVGTYRGARVIDDYAHNPAKIAASWRAIAEGAPRVLGWWRPHGFGPLALMFNEFLDTFARVVRPQDRLFILPVYYAGGTARRTVSSDDLVSALREKGVPCEGISDYSALRARLEQDVSAGDALLGMGARDPGLLRFARELAQAPCE